MLKTYLDITNKNLMSQILFVFKKIAPDLEATRHYSKCTSKKDRRIDLLYEENENLSG
jgi:hypothetical protein